MYSGKGVEIDVDGSWQAGKVAYGLVVRREGAEVYRESGLIPPGDPDLAAHRQIGGEIYAVVQAIRWCVRHKVAACTIYYDYAGLAEWATGAWKARTPLTRRYVEFLQKAPIQITWVKVPAHSGLYWNEIAHQLAQAALTPPESQTPNPTA